MKARPAADLERELLTLARLHAEAYVAVDRYDRYQDAPERDLIRLTDLQHRHAKCMRAYREACGREAQGAAT